MLNSIILIRLSSCHLSISSYISILAIAAASIFLTFCRLVKIKKIIRHERKLVANDSC